MTINIEELMTQSGVQFGTSGVRGLVKDMTDKVCFSYVTAFLQYLQDKQFISHGEKVGIAGDLRSSSPKIMNAAAAACEYMGLEPINYGFIPSPAIALFGLKESMATIMVTGSHIPDDRNGIKFNTPFGEILKPDEEGIRAQQVEIPEAYFDDDSKLKNQYYLPEAIKHAEDNYIQRFVEFLPENCLLGKKVGLYEHSSVARDCLNTILIKLGAEVTSLGRSEQFVSVDTEAIRPEDVTLAKNWAQQYQFDCIVSTDGDGDRPLISDENGNWLRGDIAGVLTAHFLGAQTVITPVSSNSAVEKSLLFEQVIRTKIGSPYVIEAMQQAQSQNNAQAVVGYEANGGFLQQTAINRNSKTLTALPTRDAAIVPITILLLAEQQNLTISQLQDTLPQRYTYSDRIKNFPTEMSKVKLAQMVTGDEENDFAEIQSQFPGIGVPLSIDTTDGLRITFDNGDVVHLRPSGNAPELRCYTEASTSERSEKLNNFCISRMKQWHLA